MVAPPGFGEWYQQQGHPEMGRLFDVDFVDTLNGWAVGFDTLWQGAIFHTSDGGNTWSVQYQENSVGLRAVAFKNNLEGWAGGSLFDWPMLLHTEDGGHTWITKGTNDGFFGNSWGKKETGKGSHLSWAWVQDIDIPDSTAGFYLNRGRALSTYAYEDAGICPLFGGSGYAEWYNEPGCAGELICFLDSLRGWHLSGTESYFGFTQDYLFATTQGVDSHTFTLIDSFPGSMGINDMDFVDTLTGWIAADSGTILHTTDGGYSWDFQITGGPDNLCEVEFIDSLNGLAVGGNGCILRTRDGGSLWVAESAGTDLDLTDICLVDTSHAWVVGDSSIILCYRTNIGTEETSAIERRKLCVYPNPFTEYAAIKLFPKRKLRVYDMVGRSVEETTGDIIGKNLPPGIYFVEAKGHNPVKITKIRRSR